MSQDPTIPPDALPPIPEAVAGPTGTRPQYSFLSPPQSSDEIGRVGKYRVLRLLGKGGMGMVFQAKDEDLHRHVALKVMALELAENKEATERFFREARAIAQVNHERIVTLYDSSTINGVPYLVMELLEGLALHDYLRLGRRLTLPQVTRIGRDIATGLAVAHRHGIIHRDIKPGNIWLKLPNGQVKILDFGLARIQNPDPNQVHSISGGLLGTPAYMSPEQALGKPIDPRSDLFSLGTVLYQLCTGQLPFQAITLFDLLEAISRQQPPHVQSWNPSIPGPLAEFIHHLLAKEPHARPASAHVVAERLGEILLGWPLPSHDISTAMLLAESSETADPPLPDHDDNETGSDPITPVSNHPIPAPIQNQFVPVPAPPERDPSAIPANNQPWGPVANPFPKGERPLRPSQRPNRHSGGQSGRHSSRYYHQGRSPFPKPLFFALMGSLACLLTALILEVPFQLLMPPAIEAPKVVLNGEVVVGKEGLAMANSTPGRVRALASGGFYPSNQAWRLLLAGGIWSAFLLSGLTCVLMLCSLAYLGQPLGRAFSVSKITLSLGIGALAGLFSQGLVLLLTMNQGIGREGALLDMAAKVGGWTVLGLTAGLALSFFLPNLSALKSALGGALAGIIGALLYVVFATLLGAMLGRWLGALTLGFYLGLLIALVEKGFRRWWLEYRAPEENVRTIQLSQDLVTIGSDPKRAALVLPSGPPIAFRYFLDAGRAFCEDRSGPIEVQPGDQQHIGNVVITLCTPESAPSLGMILTLSNGSTIPLCEGLPLTSADIPGLLPVNADETVALVTPRAAEFDVILLVNFSQQQWTVTKPHEGKDIIDPGLGIPLIAGTEIDFGRIQGTLHELPSADEF